MKANHVHVAVRDLPAAVAWLERVWELKPVFQIPQMAILAVGDFSLFLDAGDHDSEATIGFVTDDCDRDFARVTARGASVVSAPEDKPYGSRAAYLRGPGALTFELEQALKR
ncbi:MAG TPA: VOC family protein [Candidatus Binataceae bacterium]|nr:VOC family protein [Candidatus Binataceae bacterium]